MPVFGGCALCGYTSRKSYFSRIKVSKQNTTAAKPKATMVESAEPVPIRSQTQAASITPTDKMRGTSLLKVERNFNRVSTSSAVCSTGKPSRSIRRTMCVSSGCDSPRSHFETALPDTPSIAPSASCVSPFSFLRNHCSIHINLRKPCWWCKYYRQKQWEGRHLRNFLVVSL